MIYPLKPEQFTVLKNFLFQNIWAVAKKCVPFLSNVSILHNQFNINTFQVYINSFVCVECMCVCTLQFYYIVALHDHNYNEDTQLHHHYKTLLC